jgi:hypothetical protein
MKANSNTLCHGATVKSIRVVACGLCLLSAISFSVSAQTPPPTPQQLQQQSNQTIQNQSNMVHNNLNQTGAQTPQPTQPHITSSGRAVAHPPGYIPTPNH